MSFTTQIAARGATVRLHRRIGGAIAAMLVLVAPLAPAMAQVTTVDPDAAIDSDLGGNSGAGTTYSPPAESQPPVDAPSPYPGNGTPVESSTNGTAYAPPATQAPSDSSATYHQDDLIGAAEGVFGKGAKGLAGVIEDLLKKQGEPNGYILGQEASGAVVVGLRYGDGKLYTRNAGDRRVFWEGPSVGFDTGGEGARTMMLIYNLPATRAIYQRFAGIDGSAYFIGGFGMTALTANNILVVPIRTGVGFRLGANIGYLKFTPKPTWNPL